MIVPVIELICGAENNYIHSFNNFVSVDLLFEKNCCIYFLCSS